MQREILFRGKRMDNGAWVEGDLAHHKDGRRYIRCWSAETYTAAVVEPGTVGQFTGLADKNGVKIFKGDIIAFEDETAGQHEYHDSTFINRGEIGFADGAFYVSNTIAVNFEDLILGNGTMDCKVIGNIHDNPELLEEGS